MIWITGDLHGGVTAWHISSSQFKPAKLGDICLCCGDLGGVWYHDYHTNQKHRREEDYFLESQLRQRVIWLPILNDIRTQPALLTDKLSAERL
jgi:hypothetical protein